MRKVSLRHLALAMLVSLPVVLTACGGGGESDRQVQYAELTDGSVQGNWPAQDPSPTADLNAIYVVQDQQSWSRIWEERKSALVCDPTLEGLEYWDSAACSAPSPPTVDFATRTLIGLYRGGHNAVSVIEVVEKGSENLVVVHYRATYTGGSRFSPPPQPIFFTIPKTNANISFISDPG